MTDHLLVDQQDGIVFLTMNRPEVLNALSMDMRHGMFDAVARIEADPAVRCVALHGAFERRVGALNQMLLLLRRMNRPVVASVAGAAAGAGMSFMMACDLAIAASDAVFRFSYCVIGATPDGSGSYHLPRIAGIRRALEARNFGLCAATGDWAEGVTAFAEKRRPQFRGA